MDINKKEIQARLVESKKESKKEEFIDILKYLSPGTSLRAGIEGIQKAKTGGLIVAYNDLTEGLFEGGFKINTRFTSQRLIELCKMDGAIILSKDFKKILYANVLLIPNNSIPSNETGTRHKAAERIAKQADTIALAISQKRGDISLFYKNIKYELKETAEILRKAMETLQILEKHKELFEKNKEDLDKEELRKKPKVIKAFSLIQRGIMILKVADILRSYLIELGVEGAIVKSRLKEILYRVEKEVEGVIKDYSKIGFSKSKRILSFLTYDEILESTTIRQCLGVNEETEFALPKGHRILERTGMSEKIIGNLIKNFNNLYSILEIKKEDLIPFFEEKESEEILEKLSHLK